MPNWCNNYIEITGDIQPVLDVIENRDSKDVFMRSLISDDDTDLHELSKQTFGRVSPISKFSTIYGTKWDFTIEDVRTHLSTNKKDLIAITISSAWSPPEGFCLMLSKKYNLDVKIDYSESGCDFAGKSHFNNGEMVDTQEWEYLEGLYNICEEEFDEQLEWRVTDFVESKNRDLGEFIKGFHFMSNDEITELKTSIKEKFEEHIINLEELIEEWDTLSEDNEGNKHNLSTSERQDWNEDLLECKSILTELSGS